MVDWINISQNSGSGNATITVTATSYSQLLERSTALTVRTTTKSAVVGITQKLSTDFMVTPATISAIPYSGASYYLTVVSKNAGWSATTIPSWCSLDRSSDFVGDGIITLTVSSNSGSARSDVLVFENTRGLQRTVEVSQVAYEETIISITLSPSTISIPSSGGTGSFTVTSNGSWNLSAPAWISLSVSFGGSGTTTVSYNCSSNANADRNGSIVGSTSNDSSSISITQAGYYVAADGYINPSSITLTRYDDTFVVYVTSNVAWSLTLPSWLVAISPSSGMSGSSIPVAIQVVSVGATDRTGTIYLKNTNNNSMLDSTEVTQEGDSHYLHYVLMPPKTIIQFDCLNSGNTYTIPYTANTIPTIVGNAETDDYLAIKATVDTANSCINIRVNNGYADSNHSFTQDFVVKCDGVVVGRIWACYRYCCQAYNEFYTNYTITNNLTYLGVINPALISNFKIDGVSIDPTTLIYKYSTGNDPALYYVFENTGRHTVYYQSLYGPFNTSYEPTIDSAYGPYTTAPVYNVRGLVKNHYSQGGIEENPNLLTASAVAPNNTYNSCTDLYESYPLPNYKDDVNLYSVSFTGPFGGRVWNNFYGCASLQTITLPSGVTTVNVGAFSGSGLTTINCLSPTAPSLETVFDGVTSNTFLGLQPSGTIHAPSGSNYSSWASALPAGWSLVYDL